MYWWRVGTTNALQYFKNNLSTRSTDTASTVPVCPCFVFSSWKTSLSLFTPVSIVSKIAWALEEYLVIARLNAEDLLRTPPGVVT